MNVVNSTIVGTVHSTNPVSVPPVRRSIAERFQSAAKISPWQPKSPGTQSSVALCVLLSVGQVIGRPIENGAPSC